MDIQRHRKTRLRELIDHCCHGSIAEMAKKIDRSDSYVGRMLYPPDKAGAKPIGDKLMQAIEQEFGLSRAWLDMPCGTDIPGKTPATPHGDASPAHVNDPAGVYRLPQLPEIPWPFRNVAYSRISKLKEEIGAQLWQDAMDDIGKYLDVMLMKWEGEATTVKSRRAS